MLKKFLKSKVFVLSMLAISIGSNAMGMELYSDDPEWDELWNDFSVPSVISQIPPVITAPMNQLNSLDDSEWDELWNDFSVPSVISQIPPVITAPINQPMDVADDNLENANSGVSFNAPMPSKRKWRHVSTYPQNWDSSEAGQVLDNYESTHRGEYKPLRHLYSQVKEFIRLYGVSVRLIDTNKATILEIRQWFVDNWDKIKDYVNEAIQTNPQIVSGPRRLYPDGWKGSAAEEFCINHGLTNINRIVSFVVIARALGCQVLAIPHDAVEGRRIFMNEVYHVFEALPEEELQEIITAYKKPAVERKTTVKKKPYTEAESKEIQEKWKNSPVGRYCRDNGMHNKDQIYRWYNSIFGNNGNLRANRDCRRDGIILLQHILRYEREVMQTINQQQNQ